MNLTSQNKSTWSGLSYSPQKQKRQPKDREWPQAMTYMQWKKY